MASEEQNDEPSCSYIYDKAISEIAERFRKYRKVIALNINPDELYSYMCEEELIAPEEFDCSSSTKEKTEVLLNAVETKGGDAYIIFIHNCLEQEKEHLGHSYVANLLLGKAFSPESLRKSERFKKLFRRNRVYLEKHINVDTLRSHLNEEGLLTSSEHETLLMPKTSKEKSSLLLNWLETKGPNGPLLFVKCLRNETEHNAHKEIIELVESEDDCEKDSAVVRRKRKAPQVLNSRCKIQCFYRKQIHASGVIISQEYLTVVKEIHTLQYSGEYKAAIVKVNEYKASGNTEFYIALLCRNWYAYVCNKASPEEVKRMVEEAMKLLEGVKNENRAILESRLQWMLSKHSWYSDNKEMAKEYIDKSLEIQTAYNVAPGEDTLITFYSKACTLLDTLSENWSPRDAAIARNFIERANDSAMQGETDFGLYLDHHLIRLAQLCLRSSPDHPGVCTDLNDLEEADSTLNQIDEDGLSPRTKCLYYITRCDYYRNMAQESEAVDYANMAHKIAQDSQFGTELASVEKRFQALGISV